MYLAPHLDDLCWRLLPLHLKKAKKRFNLCIIRSNEFEQIEGLRMRKGNSPCILLLILMTSVGGWSPLHLKISKKEFISRGEIYRIREMQKKVTHGSASSSLGGSSSSPGGKLTNNYVLCLT